MQGMANYTPLDGDCCKVTLPPVYRRRTKDVAIVGIYHHLLGLLAVQGAESKYQDCAAHLRCVCFSVIIKQCCNKYPRRKLVDSSDYFIGIYF